MNHWLIYLTKRHAFYEASFLLCFLKILDLEKFLSKVFWYLDSLKMNLRLCTYVVQHFEALNHVGSENTIKKVASQKTLCELLVNVDGLKVTSIFVTSLVRFANISKHSFFQGRISPPCLLFLFPWICGEDVKLDLTWSPWQHTLVSMATHFTNSSTTLLQCQTKEEARLLEQAVIKVKIKKRGKGGNTGRGWVR